MGGAEVPQKQPKNGRLWLNGGSCIRLRPEYPDHVWGPTTSSRFAPKTDRSFACSISSMSSPANVWRSGQPQAQLDRRHRRLVRSLHLVRCPRSSPTKAKVVRHWLIALGAKTRYIELSSPWENGHCETFNSRLRDELLGGRDLLHAEKSQACHRRVAQRIQKPYAHIRQSARWLRPNVAQSGDREQPFHGIVSTHSTRS